MNATNDIAFLIDSSGSIGSTDFATELDWVATLIEEGVSSESRVAFIRFARDSDLLMNFTASEKFTNQELQDYARNIYYTGGTPPV